MRERRAGLWWFENAICPYEDARSNAAVDSSSPYLRLAGARLWRSHGTPSYWVSPAGVCFEAEAKTFPYPDENNGQSRKEVKTPSVVGIE
jgi:hypothetical protein